jgi:hypothetical protein
MISDDLGQRLHDWATRGEQLSPEDGAQLQEWYAQHDSKEMARLMAAPPPRDLSELQAQVQRAAAQLVAAAYPGVDRPKCPTRQEISVLEKGICVTGEPLVSAAA